MLSGEVLYWKEALKRRELGHDSHVLVHAINCIHIHTTCERYQLYKYIHKHPHTHKLIYLCASVFQMRSFVYSLWILFFFVRSLSILFAFTPSFSPSLSFSLPHAPFLVTRCIDSRMRDQWEMDFYMNNKMLGSFVNDPHGTNTPYNVKYVNCQMRWTSWYQVEFPNSLFLRTSMISTT